MRAAYRTLAYLIALEVMVQAAAIAYAFAGLGKWVEDDGGVVTKKALEGDNLHFTGVGGFAVHGLNGMMIVPLLALLLLIVSFFSKVPGGPKFAGIVVGLVVVQVALGIGLHSLPALGMLHGINALALFSMAVVAGRRVSTPAEVREPAYA